MKAGDISRKLRQLKDYTFQRAYRQMHAYEMYRRKTRKNLLILSITYGWVIVYFIFR